METYYDRAGEKTGRLIYFWGMMLGLATLAVIGGGVYALLWKLDVQRADIQQFFICYTMGAVGALVSVMARMSSGGNFTIDYEVGRPALRRIGSFRPMIGAIFAIVLYFSLRGGLIQIHAGDGEPTAFFYGALAFAAGFSERRTQILTGGAARFLGDQESEEDEPKRGPRARAEARESRGWGWEHGLRGVLERATLGDDVTEETGLPDALSLRTGEETQVLMPSRAGAGYVWEAIVDDEAVAEATMHFETADAEAVGERTFSPHELLIVRGREAGTTRVRLVQRRTWEKDVEPIGAHVITVNVADEAEATERGGTW